MKNWKSILQNAPKLLLELVVIFLSVVLAFFFDDYRESRSEKDQYKSDLLLFRQQLVGQIGIMAAGLDSFQVSNRRSNGSLALKELLDLIWLDSLIDQKRATMRDFRYIIESYYLHPSISDTETSPLAGEITIKYSDHIGDRIILNVLGIYQEEMSILQRVNAYILEDSKNLIAFIRKTSPVFEYDKQDSLYFYSKEVIWAFKSALRLRRERYGFEKYLAQNRLVHVVEGVNHELRALDTQIPGDSDCYSLDIRRRFECLNGESISGEELVHIKDLLIKERSDFLSKR